MAGTRGRTACLITLCIGGAIAVVTRSQLRNLGATAEEASRVLDGDDLLPEAHTSSTMAITIAAPRSAVWAWLVQMGCGRAGWYSFDRLDNGGVPSAERLEPEWQHIAVGDRMPSDPSGRSWFEVAALERERALVLRASLRVPSGKPFDPRGVRPSWFSDSTWSFVLDRDEAQHTRLLVRTRNVARPRLLLGAANAMFWDPAHAIMERRQLVNLRRRAEAMNPTDPTD
jgi:hypothetical protein